MAAAIHDLYDSNMRRPTTAYRSYSLYGESGQLPDVMHCEPIAERSALHDWELAPHRHGALHQLLLLRRGSGLARLDGREWPLAPGRLVNVPAGAVHAFSFEPGTQGLVVTLADEFVAELLAPHPEVRRLLGTGSVVPAGPGIAPLLEALAREYAHSGPHRALVLRGLIGAVLGRLARRCAPAEPVRGSSTGQRLLQRFATLLDAHLQEHWRVADYARALAVSPTHLSRVARTSTGAPASRLIDERVVREARRHLAFTQLNIASIAELLGFADPALFTRVFTRVTGQAPRAFRQQLWAQRP